jgi:hypothetical protein
MKAIKNTLLPIILATIWISLSEFFRNEFLLKSLWLEHYQGLGLAFPGAPINGAIWGVWSLVYAITIFLIAKKFSLLHTTIIAWLSGFVLMWLVTGNLDVLPFGILYLAVPLSILEAFLACLIIKKMVAS